MFPHERSLVERHRDKPFTLLGVNNDRDPDLIKREIEANKITWRSFKNQRGDPGGGQSISRKWQVSGYPTLFLIDHKGNIRQKWVGRPNDEELDGQIDALLKEAEAANGR
jgi:hypothetical protein